MQDKVCTERRAISSMLVPSLVPSFNVEHCITCSVCTRSGIDVVYTETLRSSYLAAWCLRYIGKYDLFLIILGE